MKNVTEKGRRIEHWHVIAGMMILYDIFAVNLACFLALWIRFDCRISEIGQTYISAWLQYMPIHTLVCVVVLFFMRLYNSIWRFASFNELLQVILATFITGVINTIGITVLFVRMPISYYVFGVFFQFLLLIGVRFSYRLILLEREKVRKIRKGNTKRDMLIGAGNAGQTSLEVPEAIKEGVTEATLDSVDGKVLEREVNGKKQKISR